MKDTIDFLIEKNKHVYSQKDLRHLVIDQLAHRLPPEIIRDTLMQEEVCSFIANQ